MIDNGLLRGCSAACSQRKVRDRGESSDSWEDAENERGLISVVSEVRI